MEATFYNCSDDNRVVDKTLTLVATKQVEYKDTDDLKNPLLIMDYDSIVEGANYCFCNGYYFYITDMKYAQQYLILQLHADLLKTYKDSILNTSVIVGRSEAKADKNGKAVYNCFLDDSRLKVENRQMVTALEFPRGLPNQDEILLVVNGR